jgi:hypothetical protein
MHSQRQKSRRQSVMAQLPNPFVYIQGSFCRTPTIVLARRWIAEDREDAVTLRSDHTASVLNHGLMPDLTQLAQELREMFRLHFPAQRCGPYQIREKHRQSMTCALSSFSGLCVCHSYGGRLVLGKAGSWLVSDRLSQALYALAMHKPTETCLGRSGIPPKLLAVITYLMKCDCKSQTCCATHASAAATLSGPPRSAPKVRLILPRQEMNAHSRRILTNQSALRG